MKRLKRGYRRTLLVIVILVLGTLIFLTGRNIYEMLQTGKSLYQMKILEPEFAFVQKKASELGILKRKTNNYGHILGQAGSYYVVQAGPSADLYSIQPGLENIYVYKNLEADVLTEPIEPMLRYELVLVNKRIPFTESESMNLKPLVSTEKYASAKEEQLKNLAAEPLAKLINAAYGDGYRNIKVNGAFRSLEQQKKLFEEEVLFWKKKVDAPYEKANEKVAKPGYSEHHTGLAVDIVAGPSEKEELKKTPFYEWLTKKAYLYGFIERYPKGKETVTDFIWEHWHYRYVGNPYAKYITSNEITLEEFIDRLRTEKKLELNYAGQAYEMFYVKGAKNIFVSMEDLLDFEVFKLENDEYALVLIR